MGVVVLGDEHHAARVLVEAMDDAGAELAADAAQVVHVKEQRVDERLVGVAGGGMDDQAGGLVDHDDVVVLVEDREREVLRLDGRRSGGGDVDLDRLAGFDALRRLSRRGCRRRGRGLRSIEFARGNYGE